MSGRYAVEMMLILWTGLGLPATHVLEVGGADIFIKFRQVSINLVYFGSYSCLNLLR